MPCHAAIHGHNNFQMKRSLQALQTNGKIEKKNLILIFSGSCFHVPGWFFIINLDLLQGCIAVPILPLSNEDQCSVGRWWNFLSFTRFTNLKCFHTGVIPNVRETISFSLCGGGGQNRCFFTFIMGDYGEKVDYLDHLFYFQHWNHFSKVIKRANGPKQSK